MTFRYATVCSGIEAPSVAWHPLAWEPVWFSEIEPFPCAVLQHHYPAVPNLGDMTRIRDNEQFRASIGTVDLLCGGTPCQSFSVAGLRKGLDDPRGNLALGFLGIAEALRPRWLVWENVPGVLSSSGGRDFGAFLGALAELGYGFAYRVLDAQFYGVPQRRRRVFVVGYSGDWRRAAAVLFEQESLGGVSAPLREAVTTDRYLDGYRAINCLDASCGNKWGSNQWYMRGHLVWRNGRPSRLTPTEMERCFAFPDTYTLVQYRGKLAADGPRYKSLGNSMAVPVMRWIGERIAAVESIPQAPAQSPPD